MTLSEYKRLELEKKSVNKNKPIVNQKIHNTFLDNTINKSNLSSLKTIFYLSSILRDKELNALDEESLIDIIIETKDMLKYTEMTMDTIRKNFKTMQQTSITFINEKEKWEMGINLLPLYKIIHNKNKVEIKLFVKIAKLIIDVETNYSYLNTKNFMKLDSKHSIRMLGLLNKISNYNAERKTESEYHKKIAEIPKRKIWNLDDMNDFFGTKYKTWGEMERSILVPVKEELDSKSGYTFIYEANFESLGRGRPAFKTVTIDLKMQNQVQGRLSL